MKIERVEAVPVACSLPRPVGDGRGLQPAVQRLLVKLTSSDGQVGWGEGGPAVVGTLQVRRVIAPLLIGADPTSIDSLHDRLRLAGIGGGLLGAVDIALWDLNGQIQGRSVTAMLGGARRNRVPAYASLHNYSESADLTGELTELVEQARAAGFRALKLKIGGRPPVEDRRYIEAARRAAGDAMDLMADANQTYDLPLAVQVGRQLEALGYRWYEEPLRRLDRAGYHDLCQRLDIAIAGGEGAQSMSDIQAHCQARAIQIAQPDVAGVGGLTPSRFLPTIAALWGVMPTWHVWNSALIHIATLHVLANQEAWRVESMAPEAVPLETTTMPNPMRESFFLDGPGLGSDGAFTVPTGPGLGVTVNPEMVSRYRLEV
jgi:L-alanine-DL-glutamate epimerase-like enolase superfamily enzyme